MSKYQLQLPLMGESISEATITSWYKKPGDRINEGDVILSVATDKVDNDIPSEFSGVLVEQCLPIDSVVKVGETVAILDISGEAKSAPVEVAPPPISELTAAKETIEDPNPENHPTHYSEVYTGNKTYSPLIRSMAQKKGVKLSELDAYEGTGSDKRFTKADLEKYLKQRAQGKLISSKNPAPHPDKDKTEAPSPNLKVIPMDRVRKIIAKNMIDSLKTSAHVQTFIEADVTNLVKWRKNIQSDFEKAHGQKLTFTPVFIEILAQTLKVFPMLNNSLEEDQIIVNEEINIGMATALPDGNLIVPVIKNADKLDLGALAVKVHDLSVRARAGSLKPEEVRGGTYTLSNIGSFGSLMGTPIIVQPQLGILAVGAIRRTPAVMDERVVIRDKIYLSHSYDHRVIDGALGGMFVKKIADTLEKFDLNRPV